MPPQQDCRFARTENNPELGSRNLSSSEICLTIVELMRIFCFVASLLALSLSTLPIEAAEPPGGALAGERFRVLVSTDIGGSDPDDFQSLIHLLLYADVLEIEGLVASPPQGGKLSAILEVLDAYERDLPQLRQASEKYPSAESLRACSKQGATKPAPAAGWNSATDGSRWIIQRAQATDPRPLWILVWGSITDVAQALHDEPTIARKIRLVSIGSWNTDQDRAARKYLFEHHENLWWVESNTTFRGMYVGGDQGDDRGNESFVEQHVAGHGALGDLFVRKMKKIKMGDTPSLLYLFRGNVDDPTSPHWGGQFVRLAERETMWTDSRDRALEETKKYYGAKTVNRWRADYLDDWRRRMERLAKN